MENNDYPCTWIPEVTCVGECTTFPSPAVNYVDGNNATYDPYGECIYAGCLNPNAVNYSLSNFPNSPDYGCDGIGCNSWVSNSSCIVLFNYSLEWEVRENNTLVPAEAGIPNTGTLDMEYDENAHCEDQDGNLLSNSRPNLC